MRITLDLPDDLLREISARASREGRTLKDFTAQLLRRGLAIVGPPAVRRRVQLPLIQTTRPARTDEEMTPKRVADLLLEEADEQGLGAVRPERYELTARLARRRA